MVTIVLDQSWVLILSLPQHIALKIRSIGNTSLLLAFTITQYDMGMSLEMCTELLKSS